MGDHDFQPTCLSSEIHDAEIRDYVLHYTGCIEECERKDFYTLKNTVWQDEIRHEYARLRDQGVEEEMAQVQAAKDIGDKMERWKRICDEEMRRVEFLRAILGRDPDEQKLVQNVVNSRLEWKAMPGHDERKRKIRDWRANIRPLMDQARMKYRRQHHPMLDAAVPEHLGSSIAGIRPLAAAATFGSNQSRFSDFSASSFGRPSLDTQGRAQSTAPSVASRDNEPGAHEDQSHRLDDYDPEWDINVHLLQYNEDPSQPGVKRQLPPEKFKVKQVLEPADGSSPLLKPGRDKAGVLRYFHLPANNMMWVENAIARYYGDQRPDYDGIHRAVRSVDKTQTYMILRPQFWRGQQHGGRSAKPHARHMRPMCEMISSNPRNVDTRPQNLVLFMPYMHWDTDRQRDRFAKEIDSINLRQKEKRIKDAADAKFERQRLRTEISEKTPVKISDKKGPPPLHPFEIQAKAMRIEKKGLPVHEGRVRVKSKLGQYLIDAARLYEAMSAYRDRKLLRKYLAEDPPLHPRRTLDQAYYWTLNTTKTRDRDQVVYRGTTAKPEDFHTWDEKKGEWTAHKELLIPENETCNSCRSNIRKVSRVIMVDQLWMWILDQQTIITSFPKRYGVSKNDPSGVHKSIRTRLERGRQNQIRSVFDLALIIIDECSNTFFDRTKTPDRQPQVIDTFSDAIGNLTNKQTTAFERLWRWTEQACNLYRSQGNPDTSELHIGLLDINPEGRLQREIKDILEELDIMIHINRTHSTVLRRFIKHVDHIMNPENRWSKRRPGDELRAAHSSLSVPSGEPSSLFGAGSELAESPVLDKGKNPEIYVPQDQSMDKGPNLVAEPAQYSRPTTATSLEPGRARKFSQQRTDAQAAEDARKQDEYHWFLLNAEELLAEVQGRIDELGDLRKSAQSTSDSLKDLLALKQQQAGVVQAWQSVKQAEEAVSQGRSILIFTVLTIIFLPLSFMTSVFGMNAVEFGQGDVALGDEFRLVFPISVGIIVITLTFAFGSWVRAVIWYAYKMATTKGMVSTRFYEWKIRWHNPTQIHSSQFWVSTAAKRAEELRRDVRKRVISERWQSRMQQVIDRKDSTRTEAGAPEPAAAPDHVATAVDDGGVRRRANGRHWPGSEEGSPLGMAWCFGGKTKTDDIELGPK